MPKGVYIRHKKGRLCSVDGCCNPHDSHGFCGMHSMRWRAHGDTSVVKPRGRQNKLVSEDQLLHPIVSLETARQLGLPKYYNGQLCKHGHNCEKITKQSRCVECSRIWQRRSQKKNRKKITARIVEWNAKRREKIAGRPKPASCEICGKTQGRIVWDHCHVTGLFRGWICEGCNRTFGVVRDDPSLLRKMADYLDRARKKAA